jgi:hypothetical protein
MGLLHDIGTFFWQCFQYDVQIFSKPWLYYTILPAIGYLIFFLVKWCILTTPLWVPVTIVLRVLNCPPPQCRNCLHSTIKEFEHIDREQVPEEKAKRQMQR